MKRKSILIAVAALLVCASAAWGIYYDMTGTRYLVRGLADLVQQDSAPGTPDADSGRLYVKDNSGTMTLYFKDDAGTANNLLAGTATALDDIGNPDANTSIDLTDYTLTMDSGDTNADMFVTQCTGAFGNYSCAKIQQLTGNPTDGTLLELVLADTDVDLLSATTGGVEKVNIADDGTITLSAGSLTLTAGSASVGGTLGVTGDTTLTGVLNANGIITLENGLTIDNASNNVLEINENSEELKLTFGTNVLDLSSTSGLNQIDLFDGAATTLTKATDGAADDLTISVTGAQNSSLVLASSGTGADAISIATSAGGMDLTVAGAAAGEDLDITADSSININSSEAAAADAVVIQASGAGSGIDIVSLADIDISTTGAAGEDITLLNTGGSINLTATEADAAAIVLDASAGGMDFSTAATFDIDLTATGGTVKVVASEAAADQFKVDAQGTVAGDAINFETTDGGIVLNADGAANGDITLDSADDMTLTVGGVFGVTTSTASATSIALTTNAGATEQIVVTNTQGTNDAAVDVNVTAGGFDLDAALSVAIGSSENTADAIQIAASAGGIDITATGAADEDLDLVNTNGSMNISGGEAAADAVTIAAGAGGIDITSAATYDIDVTATGGTVQVIASEAAANQFKVDAQGTVAGDAIVLETTDGGVLIDADGGTNGDIGLNAEDDMTLTAAGDLTLAVTGTVTAGGSAITNVLMDSETVTAANVLTSAECGKVMFLSAGAEFQTTLPAVTGTAGCEFDFYIAAAPAGANYTIVTDSSENTITGGVVEREVDTDDDGPYLAAADTVTFVQAVSALGDYVHFMSDGTTWFMTGQVNLDDALTITQASP